MAGENHSSGGTTSLAASQKLKGTENSKDNELRGEYTLHEPHPTEFMGIDKRRVFILDTGEEMMMFTDDFTKDWTGEVVFSGDRRARVVRELSVPEKHEWFRRSNETVIPQGK
ncbi:hypothetical protein LTR22_005249 [Elasticomyces elasticus]|nr:hypothetical protein LTR22_005249 [Elasticomyces elasticus]